MTKACITYYFNRLYEATMEFKKFMESDLLGSKLEKIDIVSKYAIKLRDAVVKDQTFDKTSFKDKHIGRLYRIHNVLSKGDFKIYLSKDELHKLHSPHDILFNKTLGLKKLDVVFARVASSMFNDLGI